MLINFSNNALPQGAGSVRNGGEALGGLGAGGIEGGMPLDEMGIPLVEDPLSFEETLADYQGIEADLGLEPAQVVQLGEDQVILPETIEPEIQEGLAPEGVTAAGVSVDTGEPVVQVAQTASVTDHAQVGHLETGDSVPQLQEQARNIRSVMQMSTEQGASSELPATNIPRTPLQQVMQPVAANSEKASEQLMAGNVSALPGDPRVSVEGQPILERTKVSVENQLHQAGARLDAEKTAASTTALKSEIGTPEASLQEKFPATNNLQTRLNATDFVENKSLLTSAAVLHTVEPETTTDVQQKLLNQFRHVPQHQMQSSVAPTTPQAMMQEFSQDLNLEPALQSPEMANQVATDKTVSGKGNLLRDIPGLDRVFQTAETDEFVDDPSQPMKAEPNFADLMTQSSDNSKPVAPKTEASLATATTAAQQSQATEQTFDLEQIMSKVNFRDDGSREVEMQLYPEHLGKLKMKIRQDGSEMAVEMVVSNPEAKQLVEANMAELRSRFLNQEETNIDQLKVAVDVEQHSFNESGQQQEHGGFEEDYTRTSQQDRLESEKPVSQQYRRAGVNSGLNIYA